MDTIFPTEDEKEVVGGSSEAPQETLTFSTNASEGTTFNHSYQIIYFTLKEYFPISIT